MKLCQLILFEQVSKNTGFVLYRKSGDTGIVVEEAPTKIQQVRVETENNRITLYILCFTKTTAVQNEFGLCCH